MRRILALVFADGHEGRALRLEPIAESLLAFGTRVALSAERPTIWLDVSGCAHLHATPEDSSGEYTLATRLRDYLGDAGIGFRVVIASGPVVAEGVARHARFAQDGILIVEAGAEATTLAPLPLSALPLSAELRAWLAELGCRTVHELGCMPKAALGPRLGREAARIVALLEGQDATPLDVYVPPRFPEESIEFEDGAREVEPLVFALKMLCDRLEERLSARAVATTSIRMRIRFDGAYAKKEPELVVDFSLVHPLYRAADMLAIVRSKLQAYTLPAPVLKLSLRASALVAKSVRALHLFVPESKAETVLPRLVAELEAEFGNDRVGTLGVLDDWRPEARSTLLRFGSIGAPLTQDWRLPDGPEGARLSGASVPTRLLHSPQMLHKEELRAMRALPGARIERLAYQQWWTQPTHTRDFHSLWCTRQQSEVWVEQDASTGEAWLRGWFD